MNGFLCRLCSLALLAFTIASSALEAYPQQLSSLPVLGADQVVAMLVRRNEERAEALKHYTSHRRYTLKYQGFPVSKEATMEVDASFDAPASKRFTVISETGSKLILNRVFRRLLESEQEAADEANRKKTALTTDNYTFSLASTSDEDYVLNVEPKGDAKFLYRGKIWVDGHDFAVTRIEAEPARNPSFWTTKSQIEHVYEKVDNYFYLPRQNRTVTNTRLGGVATLTIEYLSYDVVFSAGHETEAEPSAKLGTSDHAIAVSLIAEISH